MNEDQFIQSMAEIELDDQAELVIDWANQSLPNHYKCFSIRTQRVSFRLPNDVQNCNLMNAFLTILLRVNGFRYLLNGEGVDMNNPQNWITCNYDELHNEEFLGRVNNNYNNR